jgi:S-DNA-T family DNA segregation ATPase FtsK/SpoIIIE
LLLALLASCGLTTMHFQAAAVMPMSSGGIVGALVNNILVYQLNYLGSSVILLAFLLAGLTLFTGISWLKVMDGIGYYTLKFSHYLAQQLPQWLQGMVWLTQALYAQIKMGYRRVSVKKSSALSVPTNTPRGNANRVSPKKTLQIHGPVASPQPAKLSLKQAKPTARPVSETATKAKDHSTLGSHLIAPSLALLENAPPATEISAVNQQELASLSQLVEARLLEFGVQVQVVAVHPGPVITRFELELAAGIKVSKISGLAKDLARSLSVISVRVVEVIPGKSVVGLEIPNVQREIVRLKEILASNAYQHAESPLTLGLGKGISGRPICVDLAKMPHLLVAGTTGAGKSVGLNAMLLSILYKATPEQVRLILIDPKMLELAVYDDIPHLLTPVVTDMKDAANALRWCVSEMEARYQLMAALGVRNLTGYNRKLEAANKAGKPILDPLWDPNQGQPAPALTTRPYIVVVVDEFADMMMVVGKKVEELIARIAQKARAAGIHLILATQRPSVDVITGLIKANIPTRIAFQVSSRIDSRTILDQQGAEQLLGHGDMLYLPPGAGVPERIHGAYVADEEVHKVADEWRSQRQPDYIESVTKHSNILSGFANGARNGEDYDELYDEAVKVVTESRRASISHVQRRLKIGYNRAARLIEQMEEDGIVSAMQSNGSREVIGPPPPEG